MGWTLECIISTDKLRTDRAADSAGHSIVKLIGPIALRVCPKRWSSTALPFVRGKCRAFKPAWAGMLVGRHAIQGDCLGSPGIRHSRRVGALVASAPPLRVW